MDQKPKLHPAVAALIVIVLVGIVASVVIVVNATKDNETDSRNTTTTRDTTQGANEDATVDTSDTSQYEDGTYSATGSYLSPGGRESLELTVTIKDGVIAETSLVTHATDAEAEEYQELFADHYKELIVGKKMNGLSLSRVAGSSLTSNGFNDALDEIRDDAKA